MAIVLVGLPIVIPDKRHIKKHLYIMFFCLPWHHKVIIGECALAGLLLHKNLIIQLKEVHTSLQTKHLREERGLHDTVPGVELTYLLWQQSMDGLGDILLLLLCFLVELRGDPCCQQTDGIVFKEGLYALGIWIGIGQLMDGLIQQLSCQVT